MSYLTHRAERAVVAALLADPDPPFHFYGLTSADFASRLHREVFTAITDLATTHPGLDPVERDQIIAARADLPGAGPADLALLREEATDFQATANYAELVRAAAVYRDVAVYADTMARRLADGQVDDDPELAEHERKLAAALTRHAGAYAGLTADSPDVDALYAAGPDAGYPTGTRVEITPARSERAVSEDQVLADLLRDPEQIATVREFLTDNAFTSGQRRHTYRTMVTLAYDGAPVDELTVAWRMETEAAQAALHGVDVNTPGSTPDETAYPITDSDSEPTAVYLTRLAATTSTVTSAVHAGRDLLAAHLRDVLPNPKAVAEAIMAQRADAAARATRQGTRQEIQAIAQPGQTSGVRPGYTSARPPGPLPATGPEPQPGPVTGPTPGIQPGVRP